MNHIILIGFMGVGKTTIGKQLAKESNRTFVDTDEMIEQQSHMKINEIFEEQGESYFRDLETLTLRQLLGEESELIISVGGGLPLRAENRTLLKEMGKVVYLKADVHTLLERLGNSTTRPVLRGGDLKKRIEQLMLERENIYEETAAVTVISAGKSIEEVVEEITKYVQ